MGVLSYTITLQRYLQARSQTQLQTEVPEDRKSRKTSGFEEKQTKQAYKGARKGSAQQLKTSFSFHLHTTHAGKKMTISGR